MGSRWHRIFTEAYRFLAVGGLATIVAVLIFNLLVHGFHTGWDAPLSGQPYLAFFSYLMLFEQRRACAEYRRYGEEKTAD